MKTDWFYQSKFGLFVHWTTFTLYKDDKAVMTADFNKRISLYKEAVDNFPVKKFAKQVNSFGARFVIFVTSHADMVLPFPLKELDEIIPNCTCKRDLVRELIDELKKYNIKLLLYFNGDGFNSPEWQKVSKWYDDPKQHAEYCYKITKAISDRYKDDIAGWWIDNEKIYQTVDGTRTGQIKTQLNSTGTAKADGFDYSIITDAINAAMASIGGVLMSNGLINGYSIAAIAAQAASAQSTANQALTKANSVESSFRGHTHSIGYSTASVGVGCTVDGKSGITDPFTRVTRVNAQTGGPG